MLAIIFSVVMVGVLAFDMWALD